MRRVLPSVLGCFLVLLPGSAEADPYPRPGLTERVARPAGGEAASGFSRNTALSADGRFVAFDSMATNLVAGDGNQAFDVFVLDRRTGAIERISEPPGGGDADGSSFLPAVSADGRFVAFASTAANLADGDVPHTQDVFVADRETGAIERITRMEGEVPDTHEFWSPSISADGTRIAYYRNIPSTATTFTQRDVWVHDRSSGEDTLVSISSEGEPAANLAGDPAISADGRSVAFVSGASNLVPGDDNSAEDVFVRDLEDGTTERVSLGPGGIEANSTSWEPSISADGRFVAFGTGASNLVPADRNSYLELAGRQGASWDVFVRDRQSGTTERVSVASDGVEGDAGSSGGVISADGRIVIFVSHATNLVEGDDNGFNDVFVHDRVTGATELATVGPDGGPANHQSFAPALDADGSVVTFGSRATDLVPEPVNATQDVFARERGESVDVIRATASPAADGTAVEGEAAFSGARVSETSDPAGDVTATPVATGVDLTGASVAVRPERDDVLVRWDLAALPEVLGFPDEPVVYTFDLDVGGAAYRVEARPPGVFLLHACDPSCVPLGPLTGAIGSGGLDVRVAVPAGELDLAEGSPLTSMTATAGLVGAAPTDAVGLPDSEVPVREARAAVGPPDAVPDALTFGDPMPLVGPSFSGMADGQGQATWVRACYGDTCVTRRAT